MSSRQLGKTTEVALSDSRPVVPRRLHDDLLALSTPKMPMFCHVKTPESHRYAVSLVRRPRGMQGEVTHLLAIWRPHLYRLLDD